MALMKTNFFAVALLLAIVAAGCVSTPDNEKAPGVPFIKNKIEASYERPMEQVFQAAKEVVQYKGTLIRESTLPNQTNAVNGIAKVVEGKVNQETVWVRVQQVDPRVTAVTVQTRTRGGGADIDLAAEIDKQIALKLVR
jgi:hypothetical protein